MNKHIMTLTGLLSFAAVTTTFSMDLNIANETEYPAMMEVTYASVWPFGCDNPDTFSVLPGETKYQYVGACLIKQITAKVYEKEFNGFIATASPYSSSGTGYRTFQLIQTGPRKFEIKGL